MKKRFYPCLLMLSLSLLLGCQPPNVTSPTGNISRFNPLLPGRLRTQSQATSNARGLTQHPNGAVYISGVPFVSQGNDNTCGQAVMTMLLQYWEQDIDYQTVVNEGNPLNIATSYEAIQTYLRSKGMTVQGYRGGTLENLVNQIHQGQPVITLLDFGGLNQAHYVLVVGYNAQRETLIIHESRSQPYVELALSQFLSMWANEPVVNLPILGGNNYYRLMFEVQPDS